MYRMIVNLFVRWFSNNLASMLITVAITVMTLINAVLSSWITSYVGEGKVSNLMINEGKVLTAFIADKGARVLLVRSSFDSDLVVKNSPAFPSIERIELHDKVGDLFASRGELKKEIANNYCSVKNGKSVQLIADTKWYWVYCAPVLRHFDQDDLGDGGDRPTEYLGYVKVFQSKEPLLEVGTELLTINGLICTSSAVILLLLMVVFTRRMSAVYGHLFSAMHKMRDKRTLDMHSNPAEISGLILEVPEWPKDIHLMSESFNGMVYDIFQYHNHLNDMVRDASSELESSNASLREAKSELESSNASLRVAKSELESSNASLREAKDELEQYNQSVAHDLRGPVATIEGFCDQLARRYIDKMEPGAAKAVTRIDNAAKSMKSMIGALLDLAKLDQAQMQLVDVDISLIAMEILETFSASQPTRRVEWSVEPGLKARCDRAMIGIVLNNLIGNAWKFTGKKELARIHVGKLMAGDVDVFYVQDNGAGFRSEESGQLFSAFSRLHVERDFPGLGIGLTNAKRIISRHGGKIWGFGAVDLGAVFFFALSRVDLPG